MKTVLLKYGNTKVSLSFPEHVHQLAIREPQGDISKNVFIRKFEDFIGDESVQGRVSIVVADKTRLCGYDRVLPWVLETLQNHGVDNEQVTFYIAYGTHARQSDEECRAAYGEVYDRYRFIHHDSEEKEAFISYGKTSRGTDVRIRRDVAESQLILTIGAVSHHYFAGYGGGRKLFFPGLAEKNAIYANHCLFLDKENSTLARGCWPGNLTDNPLASDLAEIHHMLPDYLSIHAILDSSGNPVDYYFGRTYQEFMAVCSKLDSYYKLEVESQFDLVVASCGGFPKDINMIQAHKSVHNAANLVRDGGTLVIFAECRDGVGSKTFLPYFEGTDWHRVFRELSTNYTGNGGTALAMMEKTKRIEIHLVTDLPENICRKIAVNKITATEAQKIISTQKGGVAVVENSSMLVSKRMKGVQG